MLYDIFSSLLKQTSPEVAHQLAINVLKRDILPLDLFKFKGDDTLKSTVFGIDFINPVGLAAGFDKNAEVYNSMFKLGFGFAEVGTVTPKPQEGNPKPRVFRLNEDKAIINRLGFPNNGMEEIYNRISNQVSKGVLGVNIGPNKENATKVDDYRAALTVLIAEAGPQKRVPPGTYAELGYLELQAGNESAAKDYFLKEKAIWPEAAGYMDRMIAAIDTPDTPKASPDPSKPTPACGSANTGS